MLVVMEDGNIHGLLEFFFDIETLGGLDVLQVDAAEGRFEKLAHLDDFIGVFRVDFYVEHVDIGKALEKNAFAFHDRLSCERAYIPQTKDSCSVRNYRNKVSLCGIFICVLGILLYFQTWLGHPWRISQREVTRSQARF